MLVAATLAGNHDAFAGLVGRYTRPLFNVAYRITGSREDAADATQTAFVKCFQSLARFDGRHRFFSWLYRIGVNAALDLVRERRVTSSTAAPDELVADAVALRDHRAGSGEVVAQVQEAISLLTPDHRAVVMLRHYAGLSYDEIGAALDLPAALVKSRLFAARRRLQEILRPPEPSP